MEEVHEAHVQYDDYLGTAALEGYGSPTEIHELAEKKGMPKGYFPVAIELSKGSMGDEFSVTIFAVNRSDFGDDYKTIKAKLHAKRVVPVKAIRFGMTIQEIMGYAKRFDVVLKRKTLIGDKKLKVMNGTEPDA